MSDPLSEPDDEVTGGPMTGGVQPRGRRVLSGGSSGSESGFAATLRERAEELAGKLSVRQLTAAEAAEVVDIIFDLLANQRTGRIVHGDA